MSQRGKFASWIRDHLGTDSAIGSVLIVVVPVVAFWGFVILATRNETIGGLVAWLWWNLWEAFFGLLSMLLALFITALYLVVGFGPLVGLIVLWNRLFRSLDQRTPQQLPYTLEDSASVGPTTSRTPVAGCLAALLLVFGFVAALWWAGLASVRYRQSLLEGRLLSELKWFSARE